jgi:hypothetical protein
VLWHRWPEACTTLARLGVRAADPVALTLPATVAELDQALTCSPFLDCDDGPVVPQVLDVGPYGRRVVGFCGAGGDQRRAPEREAAPEPEAAAEPKASRPRAGRRTRTSQPTTGGAGARRDRRAG